MAGAKPDGRQIYPPAGQDREGEGNGMTILNTITQPCGIVCLWAALSLFGLYFGFFIARQDGMRKTACVFFVATAVGVLGLIFWTPLETRYECLFDKGASYTEVTRQWNVVEQRGDIWVVTAKDGSIAPVQ
jgi:hypothetical protein